MTLLVREVRVRDFAALSHLWAGRCGSFEQRYCTSPLAISNCVSHGGSVLVVIEDPDLEGMGKIVGSIVLEAGLNLVGRFFVAPNEAVATLLLERSVQRAIALFYPRVIVSRVIVPQDGLLTKLGLKIESGELPGECFAVREIGDAERGASSPRAVERTAC